MAKLVLIDARLFVGAADLTGQNNKIELDWSAEEKDTTNFASQGAKEVIAGIETTNVNGEGQWEAGDPGKIDDEMWAARRVLEPYTIGPDGAAVADLAYLTEAVRMSAKLFGTVGDVAPWTLAATGSTSLSRGLFLAGPGVAVTADTNGTAVQFSAVSAGERLYGAAHCLSFGADTDSVAVTVQSDTVMAFSGSPETRLTFDTFTGVGSSFKRTAIGAQADTWYRVQYDVEGSDPSVIVVVAVGIA